MNTTSPTTLVIFGASGDLASRYLLPAIYHLLEANMLPENLTVVGAARRQISPDSLIEGMSKHTDIKDDLVAQMKGMLRTVQMDSGQPDQYGALDAIFSEVEGDSKNATRLFYLSIPPAVAVKVIDALHASGVANGPQARVILEKPFGYDLDSARELEDHLQNSFGEDRMYRVDHYLAKEPIQPLSQSGDEYDRMRNNWNTEYVSHIEIEMRERLEVEGRVDFYEQTGALRDVLQNHLIELLAVTLMDKPVDDTAGALHSARVGLLRSVTPASPLNAVRGQYAGYGDQVGNPDTTTETFAALKLEVPTDRWRGVPIYLVTGKALAEKRSEVRMYFKDSSVDPVRITLSGADAAPTGVLDGYERVLYDALSGNRHNFVSGEEVVAAWAIVEPVMRAWHENGDGLQDYLVGSDGPPLPQ